jgi:transcriptional regulator of acetoin/glycerol metabolism
MLFDALRHPDATLEIPLWTGLTLQALPIAPADEQQTIASRLCKTLVGNLPLKDLETALIHQAVEKAKGNVAQAAQQLGISRATVYRKLGIRRPAQ